LIQGGVNALAMKPFCSRSRGDVRLLQSLQAGRLAGEEMNPFYFLEPVAPLVAARKHRRRIALADVLQRIRTVQRQCDCLLIEGAGGVMAPLGENYAAIDLIERLRCAVIVVAPNRLGTINQTLLTLHALRYPSSSSSSTHLKANSERSTLDLPKSSIKVMLMDQARRDLASRSNPAILTELLAPVPVLQIPSLRQTRTAAALKNNAKKLKKVLARVLG